MPRKTAKTLKTDMSVTAEDVVEMSEAEELAALEAALESELSEDTTATDAVDESALEAAVSEVELEEAKAEAYEEQEGGEELSTEPVEKKAKKAPRKTMTGAKKSEVVSDKVGDSVESYALVIADAEKSEKELTAQRDALLATIDVMAKKVGEKAVNLMAHINKGVKLSAYTDIAIKFLIDKGEMTAKDLIEHFQDQKANGVKGYSVGTARSQAHQMMQLLPEFKVGIIDGKTMTVNPDSLIVAKFKS